VLGKFWLGLPIMPPAAVMPPCPECNAPADRFGDHFVTCRKLGMAGRHNAVRDVVHAFCEKHHIPVAKEVVVPARVQPHCPPNLRDTSRRPADILLLGWDKGRDVAVDFTVRHPMQAGLNLSTPQAP